MSGEGIPWSKNGWEGYLYEYPGTPMGLFTLRCKKGHRVIHVAKLEPHAIENFDPDQFWNDR